MPQLSLLPPSMSMAAMLASPLPSSVRLMSWHMASGAMESRTFTMAVQVSELPATSSTVMRRGVGPRSVQKNVQLPVAVSMAQLSVLPVTRVMGSTCATPVSSR